MYSFYFYNSWYSTEKLKQAIKEYLGEENIFSIKTERKVFVTSTTVDVNPKTVLLKNYKIDNETVYDCKIDECALATSAAPTFFSEVCIRKMDKVNDYHLVDGMI
jgi:patatin-like phospholipase/acyl hydrolase